jgi:hypothetical protein
MFQLGPYRKMDGKFLININRLRFSLWYLCFYPTINIISISQKLMCPIQSSPSLFSKTFLIAYSKENLKSSVDKASLCVRLLLIRNAS